MKLIKIAIALVLVHLISSCGKGNGSYNEITASYTISASDTIKHSLGFFGDEEGASILVHPLHAGISEIERKNEDNGQIFYRYKADSNFVGNDYVELRAARGSDGSSESKDIIISKITIKVE